MLRLSSNRVHGQAPGGQPWHVPSDAHGLTALVASPGRYMCSVDAQLVLVRRGLPVEELATVDSTELATPPVASSLVAVLLKTRYVAVTLLESSSYSGLQDKARSA